VAVLRWLRGLEIEDVARELGIERNAVDQALYRARRRLRGMMAT
jgi:DNA-directed RNA polymerase specialized sigma24 family protein